MKKYVLTGGPGNGKTTIIEILASRGYAIVPEAARIVIDEEKVKESEVLPWKNLVKFQARVVQKQLELEQEITAEITFLDRSIIDGHAYCQNGNIPTPEIVAELARDRYDLIFFVEPLGSYAIDDIRFETQSEAIMVHQAISSAYKEFGYELISVPPLSPDERVELILNHLFKS